MAKRKTRAAKGGNFWQRMDVRSRMFFVLALCSAALLITVIGAFVAVHTAGGEGEETSGDSSVVSGSDYDQSANSIDASQYDGTVLAETEDAGEDYVDSTLFLGDSNTARMRFYGYCTLDNSLASVGMSARQLESYACVQFAGYSNYVTMPEAVALMQPERVIITFGTNDAGTDVDTFIENYEAGIQAVEEAYPSVDIIVNSVPPIGRSHINSSLDQEQLDEYNRAIVEMCEANGWKFLNSAEALKGSDGYAKSDYVIADGIHLTQEGLDALFAYIRTHSYITEDDRPTLTSIPEHTGDKDVSAQTASSVVTSSSSAPASSSSQATPTPEPASSSQASSSSQTYTYWEEVIAPTCTEKGYTVHHCNEDSSRDYIDSEVAALGHDGQTQSDGSIVCSRCGTVLQAAPTPTPPPTPEPTPTPEPSPSPSPSTAPPTEPTAPTDGTGNGDLGNGGENQSNEGGA